MSIRIKFWGIRGSIAVSGKKFTRYGGNTSCVEISSAHEHLIFDAGTGLRELGNAIPAHSARTLTLFLSHYHLDHIFGLPFFKPLYNNKTQIRLYGPGRTVKDLEKVLDTLFKFPLFPVDRDKIPAQIILGAVGDAEIQSGVFSIRPIQLNHPGKTCGYVVQKGTKRVAYVTDHEPIDGFCHESKQRAKIIKKDMLRYLQGVDVLIHDAHFFDGEYDKFRGWGHSPVGHAIERAQFYGVKKLILTHHAPEHDDRSLDRLKNKIAKTAYRGLTIKVAYDGLTLAV